MKKTSRGSKFEEKINDSLVAETDDCNIFKKMLLKIFVPEPIATDSLEKIKPKFSIENTEVEIVNEGSDAPGSRNLNAKKQFKQSVQKKLTNDMILNKNLDFESSKRDKNSTDIIPQQHNIFNSSLNNLQFEKLSAVESSKRWTDIAKASNEIRN